MISTKGKKFVPGKGEELTPAQKEYNAAIDRLAARARRWRREQGFEIEIPDLPTDFNDYSATEIESTRYKNLTDVREKQLNFVRKYGSEITFAQAESYGYEGAPLVELGKTLYRGGATITPEMVSDHPELTTLYLQQNSSEDRIEESAPNTESKWLNDPQSVDNRSERQRTNRPSIDEQQVDEFFENLKDKLTDYYMDLPKTWNDKLGHEHQTAKDLYTEKAEQYAQIIADNIDWAVQRHPNKAEFYRYLNQPDVAAKLEHAASFIYSDSDPLRIHDRDVHLLEILTILNYGRPLTSERMESITSGEETRIDFDYSEYENEY